MAITPSPSPAEIKHHIFILGGELRPGHVAHLQLAVYLRGINDGWNSRGKAAENRGQDGEYQIVLHRDGRQSHSRLKYPCWLQRSRRSGRLQTPAALQTHRRCIRVVRPALRTKHVLPPEKM